MAFFALKCYEWFLIGVLSLNVCQTGSPVHYLCCPYITLETEILFFVQIIICLFIHFTNVLIICQLIKCMIVVVFMADECSVKTEDGECCVFPFLYKGIKHNSFTKGVTTDRKWCGTTYNYDQDKKWGWCQ